MAIDAQRTVKDKLALQRQEREKRKNRVEWPIVHCKKMLVRRIQIETSSVGRGDGVSISEQYFVSNFTVSFIMTQTQCAIMGMVVCADVAFPCAFGCSPKRAAALEPSSWKKDVKEK